MALESWHSQTDNVFAKTRVKNEVNMTLTFLNRFMNFQKLSIKNVMFF